MALLAHDSRSILQASVVALGFIPHGRVMKKLAGLVALARLADCQHKVRFPNPGPGQPRKGAALLLARGPHDRCCAAEISVLLC